jgi:hypothetical protein
MVVVFQHKLLIWIEEYVKYTMMAYKASQDVILADDDKVNLWHLSRLRKSYLHNPTNSNAKDRKNIYKSARVKSPSSQFTNYK